MPGFIVDPRTLLAVRDRLGQLHCQLLGIHTSASGFEGILGGRGLEAQLEAFCGRSGDDVVGVGAQIGEMMARLAQAADAYERIEAGVTAVARHRAAVAATRSGYGTTTIDSGGSSWSSATVITSKGGATRIIYRSGASGPHPPPIPRLAPPHAHPPASSGSGSGSGSGTTTIGGGGPPSRGSGSGAGTTTIGGSGPPRRGSGSGTTTIS